MIFNFFFRFSYDFKKYFLFFNYVAKVAESATTTW